MSTVTVNTRFSNMLDLYVVSEVNPGQQNVNACLAYCCECMLITEGNSDVSIDNSSLILTIVAGQLERKSSESHWRPS